MYQHLQQIISEEEIKSTPKKQDIYDWIHNALNLVSPRDVVKAFLTSGVSVALGGEEDALSSNVMRLRKEVVDEKLEKAGPEDLESFMADQYTEKEDEKRFVERELKVCSEDEEELILNEKPGCSLNHAYCHWG